MTDSGTPALHMTIAQVIFCIPMLLKIAGNYSLTATTGATAAQAVAIPSTVLAKLSTSLTVTDTAANIVPKLDGLQSLYAAGKLSSISLSGPTALSVTAATLVADSGVLGVIQGPYALTVASGTLTVAQATSLGSVVASSLGNNSLSLLDSAANVAVALDTLQSLAGMIGSVALTDASTPTITVNAATLVNDAGALALIGGNWRLSVTTGSVTVAQATALSSTVTTHLTSGLALSDTAAHVAAALDALQAAGSAVGSITVTDSGTQALSVTAAQLVADGATLLKISTPFRFTASGAATVAQAAATSSTLAGDLTGGLAVSDSAANVSAGLASLQGLGSTIGSVALTGSPASFAVTADQLWHDAGILTKISAGGAALVADSGNTASAAAAANLGSAPAYTGALLFADSAANVANAIDSLQSLAAAGHLGAITLSDSGTPTLSITATQLVNDAAALAMIGGGYALSLTNGTLTTAQTLAISSTLLAHLPAALPVRDSSANILANLAALQARVSAIASVAFTDGTPTFSLTPTQVTSDIGVLSLASGYSLSISGTLSTAQATTLSPTSVVAHLTTGPVVSDTAANVSASLASLMTLANAGKLGSITLTDNGTPTLSVTPGQLTGNVAVLRKITSNYTLAPTTNLTADQAANVNTLLVGKLPSSVAVSDTAAHVLADLDGLQVLAAGNHLGSVTLTDSGTPVLQVTGDQVTSDAAALSRITGSYQLNIMGGITAAQAAAYAVHPAQLATSVHVVDAASAVASNMASLQTLAAASLLSSIAFTNSGTPSMTLAAPVFAASATALGAIIGNYTITLTGTLSVAQIAAAVTAGLLAFVPAGAPIGDTAANVQAALDALKFLGNAVASITLTDVGTPTVTVSPATLLADTSVLMLISNSTWRLALTPGTLTVAQATGLPSSITGHLSTGLSISDTAALVGGAIDSLQTLGSAVLTIALTDTSPVLSLTAARFLADTATLLKISGAYGVTLSGTVTVTQALGVSNVLIAKLASGLAVSDIADNVASNLSGLQNLAAAGKLLSVALTDSSTPTITINSTVLVTDASVLALIGGAWTLSVNSGSVTVTQALALPSAVTAHLSPGLTVSDSANNVATSIDALQGMGGRVTSIALTDVSTPALSLTAAQLVADATTLGKISPSFTITLSGALSVAQAQTAQFQGLLTLVTGGAAISDTAGNVQGALGTLLGFGNAVASIVLTDTSMPTISITASGLVTDAAVLAKITTSAYRLTVSPGTTVMAAQAAGLPGGVTSHLTGGLAISDSVGSVTASLSALQSVVGTIASITLTDSGTPTITVSATTLVSDAGALALIGGNWRLSVNSGSVTVAQATALSSTVTTHLTSGLALSDTAAHVAAALDALQAAGSAVGSITVTDSGTQALSVTAAQLVADGATLLKISGSYTITLPGSATVSQATSADSTLVSHLNPGFAVSDTAANVTASLDGLQTLVTAGKLASATLTDGGTPTLTITATTLVNDAGALALITSPYRLTLSPGTVTALQATGLSSTVTAHLPGGLPVLDSASSVSTNIDALQALGGTVASIALNDGNTPALSITSARLIADSAALLKVSGSFGIAVSDNPTAAQAAAANATLLGHLATGLAVRDTAALVTASLDGLQALTPNAHLASITLTDSTNPNPPTLSISAAALVNDAGALALIGGSWNLGVASGTVTAGQAVALSGTVTSHLVNASLVLSDTAAQVASNIDALQALAGKVGSIALTDSTPVLSLTATQFVTDATTLLKIGSPYNISLSGALALTDAATASGQGLLAKVSGGATISDNATNVQNGLDALQGYGSQVASIVLTGSSPTITVNATTLYNDNEALAKIGSAYLLTVSDNPTAAQAASLSPSVTAHLAANAKLAVSDTASGLVASLDALQAKNASLASIALTDGTPALSITAAQLVADAPTLLLITTPFTIALSGVLTEAQAAAANAQTSAAIPQGLLSVVSGGAAISDTAADIQNNLGTLQTLGSKIASIALTDAPTPTISITSAALLADATTVGKISGAYNLTIGTDTLAAADAIGIDTGITTHLTDGFSISDTASNVTNSIAGLQTLAAANHLASIALTDGGNPQISLSAAVVAADTLALTHITGSWFLAASGAFTAPQAATLVADGLITDVHGTINITDSASRMMANLGALQQFSLASKLGTVTLNTAPSAFSVTVAQATSNVGAINAVLGANNANSNEVLYINGASGGDTVNTTQISHAVNISLEGNSATMSFAGSGPIVGTINGNADTATVGNAAGARIQDTLSSGVEVIYGFQAGRDILDLQLNNADPSTLTVTDVTVNGTTAVALALSGDPTHGAILMSPGILANDLTTDHLFAAGSHVLIS